MLNQFSREELIIGKDNVEKLHKSKVAIFGVGGVGSFVCEGLARAGVENFVIVDHDRVDITNLNRQIIALHSTIDKFKVDVIKERILDINPKCNVTTFKEFFSPESSHEMIDNSIDYIVDAVDTVTAKIELIVTANKLGIPIISAMGTGNKLDPTQFEVTDIYKTEMCPLAKVLRKELRKRGIPKLKVVYSKEQPIKINNEQLSDATNCEVSINTNNVCKKIEKEHKIDIANEDEIGKNDLGKKHAPGSISFVPSVAGLIIVGEVVKDIIKQN